MKVIRTIGAHQPGAQKYRAAYGENLIAVRYRQDKHRRLITVELVVDARDTPEPPRGMTTQDEINAHFPVALRVRYDDNATRQLIKRHNAKWSAQQKLWYLPRGLVHALNLAHLIVEGAYGACTDVDFYAEDRRPSSQNPNYPYRKKGY